jgi:hypothetical protein
VDSGFAIEVPRPKLQRQLADKPKELNYRINLKMVTFMPG